MKTNNLFIVLMFDIVYKCNENSLNIRKCQPNLPYCQYFQDGRLFVIFAAEIGYKGPTEQK